MSGGCLGLGSNKLLESTSELQMKPQVDLIGALKKHCQVFVVSRNYKACRWSGSWMGCMCLRRLCDLVTGLFDSLHLEIR